MLTFFVDAAKVTRSWPEFFDTPSIFVRPYNFTFTSVSDSSQFIECTNFHLEVFSPVKTGNTFRREQWICSQDGRKDWN